MEEFCDGFLRLIDHLELDKVDWSLHDACILSDKPRSQASTFQKVQMKEAWESGYYRTGYWLYCASIVYGTGRLSYSTTKYKTCKVIAFYFLYVVVLGRNRTLIYEFLLLLLTFIKHEPHTCRHIRYSRAWKEANTDTAVFIFSKIIDLSIPIVYRSLIWYHLSVGYTRHFFPDRFTFLVHR